MLHYQIEFAAWANARVLAAAQGLTDDEVKHDFKTADHSVLGTLVHVYRSERIWLARIQGQFTNYVVPGDDAFAALAENWPALGQQWIGWSRTLTDE